MQSIYLTMLKQNIYKINKDEKTICLDDHNHSLAL
jgi:hypothetical protein